MKKEKVLPRVWLLLLFAWLAQATCQVLIFGGGMLMPSVIETFQITVGDMGRIGLAAGLSSVVMTVPITIIAPKFNKKYFMFIIILTLAAGLFLYGTAAGIPMLYLGRMITGFLGQGIAATLVLVKIGSVPSEQMQKVNGVENFVGPLGQIVATMFMAQFLSLVNGWRNVYIILGIVLLLCATGWLLLYGDGSMMIYNKEEAEPVDEEKPDNAFKLAITNRNIWLVALAWPFTTLVWLAMFTYWPIYATTSLNLELAQVGLILSFIPIFSAIASLTSPILANKLGKDKPFIWPWGFILPVIYFGMLQTSNVYLLCLLASIAGYGAYCFIPLAMTIIYKLGLPKESVSIGVGIVLTCISIGTTLGGGVVGVMGEAFGLYNAMAISCLSPIIFGILTLMLPELGRKKMEEMKQGATTEP